MNQDDNEEDCEHDEDYGFPEGTGYEWLEAEIANNVGWNITIKTYDQDYVGGRIVGVRNGSVFLLDENKNRIYCDLSIIALYCIINPKAKKDKVAKVKKAPTKKKAQKSDSLPIKGSKKKKKS